MPLTKKGQKLLKKFNEEYGEKGKSIFFGYLNKHPHLKELEHGRKKRR